MSVTMDDSIKRWTAKRKTALVVEIIQGKTTVAAGAIHAGRVPCADECSQGAVASAARGYGFGRRSREMVGCGCPDDSCVGDLRLTEVVRSENRASWTSGHGAAKARFPEGLTTVVWPRQ